MSGDWRGGARAHVTLVGSLAAQQLGRDEVLYSVYGSVVRCALHSYAVRYMATRCAARCAAAIASPNFARAVHT